MRAAVALALCAAMVVSNLYLRYVSQHVYDEGVTHLAEVYGQVNKNLHEFVDRTWKNLDDWSAYLGSGDTQQIRERLQSRQDTWAFSELYFISSNGVYQTLSGNAGSLADGASLERLFGERRTALFTHQLHDGNPVVMFGAPCEKNTFCGFSYEAIAVSYTNAAIAAALDTEAFGGASSCFVVDADGMAVFTADEGAGVLEDYETYLMAVSDLGQEGVAQLLGDWRAKQSGVREVTLHGVPFYMSYQPLGFYDYTLVGLVPVAEATGSLTQVQSATLATAGALALMVLGLVLAWLLTRLRRSSRLTALEVKSRDRLFALLSDSNDDVCLMVDARTGDVNYVTPNVERLTGISAERAHAGVEVFSACSADGVAPVTWQDLQEVPEQASVSHEGELLNAQTGERRWCLVTYYHQLVEGEPKYIVVLADRTRERSMTEKLRSALENAQAANEAKSHFLSSMSHDIRTPMNAILGFTDLLNRRADRPDEVRNYVRKIETSSHHLLGLINDVLDMSKIESGKTSLVLEDFDLPHVLEGIHDIMAPQAEAKRQTLLFRAVGVAAERLVGDRLRLEQVLVNLLSNAVKYTPEEGHITLTVETLPSRRTDSTRLRFQVADDGIGMDEEFQKVVFDSFTREVGSQMNKVQGTGLGMAITKNIVTLMGGTIDVKSAKGVGSTFTVELTLVKAETEDESFWRQARISRALVVDDLPDVRERVPATLATVDIPAEAVASGEEALMLVRHAREAGEPFDLVLLDCKMPGLSGLQTAQLLRDQGYEGLLIMLTAYGAEEVTHAPGADGALAKPFFLFSLKQVLEGLRPMRAPDAGIGFGDSLALEGPASIEGLRFLAAEDNPLNAELLSERLDMEGAQVDIGENGLEMLKLLEAHEAGHYDMILLDVQMPVMNGYEAARAVRGSGHPRAATIPIAAMTADVFTDDVRKAEESGMDAHLAKPIDMEALKEVAARLTAAERSALPQEVRS